ncbi:MAG: hypothetical protein NT088_00960 [Candidatus Omnitrophica bacterium]|nr:hypothetical protein [Candidatus Omnitrophota bacterium]
MIENITDKNKTIAIIVYNNYEEDGIKHFSPPEFPLQVGCMKRPKGYKITPHLHNPVSRATSATQEVLFIRKGTIRVDFYSSKRKFIQSRKLSAGDAVLFAEGGHAIDVLEEAVIIEVKNGPYSEENDKTRFIPEKGKDDPG